jgi:hypothetical protein
MRYQLLCKRALLPNFCIEDPSALSQLPALTANEVRAASVQAGASTNVSAQALPGTDIIHGEPEPVVVGPLQQLPFLTVNEFVPLDPRPPLSFLSVPPDSTVGDGLLVHDDDLLSIILMLKTRNGLHC